MLLDEPFTGLDDASTRALIGRLAALKGGGAIVLIATHDLETVDGLVDRAAVLRDGRLTEVPAGPIPLRDRYRAVLGAFGAAKDAPYNRTSFAVACVMVFAFGFVREGRAVTDAAAGILWIAIAFSGTLALGRAFERERQNETLRALMLAPVDRPALYVGKLAGVLILLALVEVVLVPLVALMFQLVRARSRDVLLPLLLYPMTIPVLIAGVRGTAALLQADVDEPMARAWLAMLACFDVVFITLALWTFEPVMSE